MIRNPAKFHAWPPASFDGVFDWDFLKPAFLGTKIMPMDLDATIERGGHFLGFETKEPGTPIPQGQAITLTKMWASGWTIMHIDGKTPETIQGLCIYWEGGYDLSSDEMVGSRPVAKCGANFVVFQARRWFCRASGWPVPTWEEWTREFAA